jgi:hypothetical protein
MAPTMRETEAALVAHREQSGACTNAAEVLTDLRELGPHTTVVERRDLVRLVLTRTEVNLRAEAQLRVAIRRIG